jgi:glycosyltransferase involved in cell wall biosynthesis
LESATFFKSSAIHLKKYSYDLIHAHFPLDVILKSVTKDPLLLHIHGDPSGYGNLLKSVKAEGYAACSEHVAREVQEIVGEKVHIVYNGVDTDFFSPSPKMNKGGKMILLFLGALDLNKGLEYLLRAFKKIESENKNIQLWIAGRGPDEEKIHALVGKLNLRNVKFLGFVPQKSLPSLYSTADAFILPSINEPFGITILESMSCGTPAIATNEGGPKEIITKDIGFLIKSKSVSDIVKTVLDIEKYDLDKIGNKARKTVMEKFTWNETLNSLLKVYKKIGK